MRFAPSFFVSNYYKLINRLERAETWAKYFIETERQIEISDKVTQDLGKESPVIHLVANLVLLPTICLTFLKKVLVWQSYKKCKKEIEILRKEIEKYE